MQSDIAIRITEQYANYHISKINTNRFTHKSFISALKEFENFDSLKIETIGYSEEVRCIKSITYGKGKTKVLLWSQMHGNESTATRAILDILSFLTSKDEFDTLREKISKELTLMFIPMLNPDGTDRFQRRTATEIDMNRDAVHKQSPEGKLLHQMVEEFKPSIAFNLHDQRRFYNVAKTGVPSSMSFLAPAYNDECEVNSSRERAMQLIAGINKLLQNYIPNGVGLYDDTHSHRSFGDYIQAKGISTILIESGWLANDMEKEAIRKLNFTALIGAFQMIAETTINQYSVKEYDAIPKIDSKLFDVLIKDVKINKESESVIDIGINRTEHLLEHPNYCSKGTIDELGNLSAFYGFETVKAKGLTIKPGKTVLRDRLEDISMVSAKRLLNQGVLFIITQDVPIENHVPFPINLVHPRKIKQTQEISFEGEANFLMVDKNNVIKYIVLNGFLVKPNKIDTAINGLVLV